MKWNGSIIQTFFFSMLIFVVLTGVIIGGMWIAKTNVFYQSEVEKLKSDYIDIQKIMMKNEIDGIIEEINFNVSNVNTRLEQDIKEKTYQAYAIGNAIYEEYNGVKTDAEIKDMYLTALRNIRFNGDRGYYFVYSMEGDALLYPTKPELEGQNFIDLKDQQGNFVVQEEIHNVKSKNEGFVDGYWSKPNYRVDQSSLKRSFVKYFEPFNWYIGTGEYMDDVIGDIKEETYSKYRDDRYTDQSKHLIFIVPPLSKDVHQEVDFELNNLAFWNLNETERKQILEEEIKLAKENKEGVFVAYDLNNQRNNEDVRKIAFVREFSDWGIVIGSRIEMDALDEVISNQKKDMHKAIFIKISNIIWVILGVLLVMGLMIKRMEKQTLKNFSIFYNFFEKVVQKKEMIDLEELNFEEFINLAEAANRMLTEQIKIEHVIKEMNENLELTVEERTKELESSIKKLTEAQNLIIKSEKLSLIGGLVNGLTRELDNPLGITLSLLSNIERLTEGFESHLKDGNITKTELVEYLSDIHEEIRLTLKNLQRAIELIEQFKKISAHQSSGEKDFFDIKDFVEKLAKSMSENFNRPQIPVRIICDDDIEIFGDTADYSQIFNNLFVNAYIHGFDFDSVGEITIEIMLSKTQMLILFKDNGKGIAEEDLQRIFEPFFTTRKEDGQSGLGLNIVYNIVTNKLGGSLNVFSREGFGTEYELDIPLENGEVAQLRMEP